MKTLEYVKEHFGEFETDEFFDHRFTKRFLDFIPVTEFEKYGFRYCGEDEHVIKDWTEENIIAQLKKDCAFSRNLSFHRCLEFLNQWSLIGKEKALILVRIK